MIRKGDGGHFNWEWQQDETPWIRTWPRSHSKKQKRVTLGSVKLFSSLPLSSPGRSFYLLFSCNHHLHWFNHRKLKNQVAHEFTLAGGSGETRAHFDQGNQLARVLIDSVVDSINCQGAMKDESKWSWTLLIAETTWQLLHITQPLCFWPVDFLSETMPLQHCHSKV